MVSFLRIISISASLAIGILCLYFFPEIKESVTQSRALQEKEASDQMQAGAFIEEGRAQLAIPIIAQYKDEIEKGSIKGQEWLSYLIDASVQLRDSHKLAQIFNTYPKSLNQNERASLLAGTYLIGNGHWKDYELLRFNFKGEEEHPAEWLNLDADSLVLQGKNQEAEDLLSTQVYEGKEDTGRLIRLGLLHINEHPKISWDYLNQALKKDPNSSDVRIYRAQLLNSSNKKDLALKEFLIAMNGDPQNNDIKNDTADMLMQKGDHKKSLSFFSENLKSSSNPNIWIDALFLNKAILPVSYSFQKEISPAGAKRDYIEYLISLSPEQFWDDSHFKEIKNREEILRKEQSSFWLRVLNSLKEERERDALMLLNHNPFEQNNWNPALASALKKVIGYRKNEPISEINLAEETPFLTQIIKEEKNGAITEETKKILDDPFALIIPFIETGWVESAFILHGKNPLPSSLPSTVVFSYLNAMKDLFGKEETIEYIKTQHSNPALNLYLAELYIENNNMPLAIPVLKELSFQNSEIGLKANELLSTIYYETGEYWNARNSIMENPNFKNSVKGNEILARIALKDKDTEEADRIYGSIENVSTEAKSYFAKKAYESGDMKKALELTEDLLKHNPNSKTLKENKEKIQLVIDQNS